jgi:hypothetical protein
VLLTSFLHLKYFLVGPLISRGGKRPSLLSKKLVKMLHGRKDRKKADAKHTLRYLSVLRPVAFMKLILIFPAFIKHLVAFKTLKYTGEDVKYK